MDFGFQFDMDWVLIVVSVIVAVTAAVILSRQKKTARIRATVKPVEPEIPTLTDAVHTIDLTAMAGLTEAIAKNAPKPLPEFKPITLEIMKPTLPDPTEVFAPAPDPLARWNSAPSQWAKFTFMTFAELFPVANKNGISSTQVAELFSAYNKKLQLPGLYDAKTNLYAFQRLEITDKKVYEPDIDGAADRYIAQQFPAFVVKKIA